jgi:hypothetical protein
VTTVELAWTPSDIDHQKWVPYHKLASRSWYCIDFDLLNTYIDASSPMVVNTERVPIHTIINPYTEPAYPPFVKPIAKSLLGLVSVHATAKS